jgi:hypothetical protein
MRVASSGRELNRLSKLIYLREFASPAFLLQLGFDWLNNVLFNEQTINMKEDVLQAAIARGCAQMGAT